MVIQKPPQKRAANGGAKQGGTLAKVALVIVIVAALGFVGWRVLGGGSGWSEARVKQVEQSVPGLPADPSSGLSSGPTMGPGGAYMQFRQEMQKSQPGTGR